MDQFIRETQKTTDNKNDMNIEHSNWCGTTCRWGVGLVGVSLFAYIFYKALKQREQDLQDPEFIRYYSHYKKAELMTMQHSSWPHDSYHIHKLAGQLISGTEETDHLV